MLQNETKPRTNTIRDIYDVFAFSQKYGIKLSSINRAINRSSSYLSGLKQSIEGKKVDIKPDGKVVREPSFLKRDEIRRLNTLAKSVDEDPRFVEFMHKLTYGNLRSRADRDYIDHCSSIIDYMAAKCVNGYRLTDEDVTRANYIRKEYARDNNTLFRMEDTPLPIQNTLFDKLEGTSPEKVEENTKVADKVVHKNVKFSSFIGNVADVLDSVSILEGKLGKEKYGEVRDTIVEEITSSLKTCLKDSLRV